MPLREPTARQSAIADGRARLSAALATDPQRTDVLARYDRWSADLWDGLSAVYDAATVLTSLVDVIAAVHLARPDRLRQRDRERTLRPDWFQDIDAIGYVAYADLFAGDLQGIRGRIGYLRDLHVTYLHLMPLLTPRPGANDGGYAVMDYRSVRPDLGSMADLAELAADLHDAGISLTLDLVLNHVAREHRWAERAKAGDPRYRDYFYVYPDRTVPDAYEATLPEVFPAFAPGNFTWDDDPAGLGVDDVQLVAVGRQLVESRRVRRVRRRDRLPGQPGRRLHPARRHRVRLEAAGHQLPEPARGARDHPGPAGVRPHDGPGGDLQGRGHRRPEGRRRLPRPGRACRQGLRSRVPQLAHGPDLVGSGGA